jgi:hypothetical protein
MKKKTYSVSLCLSIEAENEDEARQIFGDRISVGEWESGSIDVELEEII